MVEAVNCFGSGVAGLSVLTLTHTPPPVDFTHAGNSTLATILSVFSSRTSSRRFGLMQTFFLAPRVVEPPCSAISCPPVVARLPALQMVCSLLSRTGIFPGFYPRGFSFCGSVNSAAVSFPHGLICGVCNCLIAHAQVGRW